MSLDWQSIQHWSQQQWIVNVGAVILLVLFTTQILKGIFFNTTEVTDTVSHMTSEETTAPRPVTQSELSIARGEGDQPIYIAVKDPFGEKVHVFDVTSGKDFYGPGSGYHLFSGRDATYGLATTSLDPSKLDGDISTLSAMQKDTHIQWYNKYLSKYPVVGFLVPDDFSNDHAADSSSASPEDSKKDA